MTSLRRALSAGDAGTLWAATATVSLRELADGSTLSGHVAEIRDRSALVLTSDPVVAAVALIEVDGLARRLVLCPPDLALEHLPFVIATAGVDTIISDLSPSRLELPQGITFVPCSASAIEASRAAPARDNATEWILFTSGTTGRPKMVVHTLSTLAAAVPAGGRPGRPAVWGTFYDIRRYGGLQVLLRVVIGGGSLVLTNAHEVTTDYLTRAQGYGVTHMTGTPSQWRQALLSPAAHRFSPRYVRLSGEIADQGILVRLRDFFPGATVAHAFASTEAGVAFEIQDGLAGFPEELLAGVAPGVEMRVRDGSLRIRSPGTALGYLGGTEALRDADGFLDTTDMVELSEQRFRFTGRRGGIINVGGLKVHPEEVESVINRHPGVRLSLVKSRKNPITGAVVTAEIVPALESPGELSAADAEELRIAILDVCRRALAPHKVPAAIHFVSSLAVTPSGKLVRPNA